ncbi:MAG: helix-turn-helix transcriptional regulator [Candidatus Gastranaerophilaceae bacterium]|nr:helix-turn-helix transcriptional regulator [Candidatus Gastranaerophilaceae bacterium]
MDNKKLLGKRIKELRKLSDLTQEKFSEMIGIETTSLSGIESGRHFPSMPTLEKIANNLNVELKTLFEFNHLHPINEIKQDIIKNIDKLDDNQIKLIYKFFDGISK